MEPDEDEYQEQQDSLNVNEQTWRDGSMSTSGNGDKSVDEKEDANDYGMGMSSEKKKEPIPDFSIADYEKQLTLWSSLEFKEQYQGMLDLLHKEAAEQAEKGKMGKEEEPRNLIEEIKKAASLPTGEELSERFGGSFAPVLERFKEQIRFEIEDGTMALKVPLKLDVLGEQLSHLFKDAAEPMLLKLKDAKPNKKDRLFLEMCRVDIRIDDLTAEAAEKEGEQRMLRNKTIDEESYYIINRTNCRDIDEDGIIGNPSLDGNEAELIVFDEKHERKLKVSFTVFLQKPKK